MVEHTSVVVVVVFDSGIDSEVGVGIGSEVGLSFLPQLKLK